MSSDLPPMGIGPDLDQEVSFHSCSEDSVQSRSEGLVPLMGVTWALCQQNPLVLIVLGTLLQMDFRIRTSRKGGGEAQFGCRNGDFGP